MNKKLVYTLRDEDGELYPIAGIFKYDQYGLDDAEERAVKVGLQVATVELVIVDGLDNK